MATWKKILNSGAVEASDLASPFSENKFLTTDTNGTLEWGSTSNNYADSLAFSTSTGVLTLGRTGSLADLTVDLDGKYAESSHTHQASDISVPSTSLTTSTVDYDTDTMLIYDNSASTYKTFNPTDLPFNNYTHPSYNGDDFSVDTGALTGADVVSDIDINITTNSSGHVTDANGSVSTRTLTLANLGYTGDTNANNYSLPTASASTLGGVKIGSGVSISNGTISVSTDYASITGDTFTGNVSIDAGTSGDAILTIRSDTDNNAEGDHPSIKFLQDGDLVGYRIGIGSNDGDTSVAESGNGLTITNTTSNSYDSFFWSPNNGTNAYKVFHDNYHPNADKWTTARTLSLTGAVTGSVSWDGSGNASLATTATSDPTLTLSGDASGSATFTNLGNATLSVTVADDSHNHTISNVDNLQSSLDAKASLSGCTFTGDIQINEAHPQVGFTDTDDNSDSRIYHSAGSLYIDADNNNEVASSKIRFSVDDSEVLNMTTSTATFSGNLAITGTVDGRDVASDGSKLDGIAVSANNYSLPTASATTLGGVKVGTNLSISSGVLSATDTNTTYSADGNYGMTLSGTAFRLEDDRRRNSSTADIYSGNTHDFTFYDADVGIRWYTANAEDMRLTDAGDLHVDGDIIAYSSTVSDISLKQDISPITNALDIVSSIEPIKYKYNYNDEYHYGVSAQELKELIPEIVKEKDLSLHTGVDGEKKLTVRDKELIPFLIQAIKELKEELDGITK